MVHAERLALQSWSDSHPIELEPLLSGLAGSSHAERVAVFPSIYVAEPFTRDWCDRLTTAVASRVQEARAAGMQLSAPNSMNRYGVILDDLGFTPVISRIVKTVVEPMAKQVFPEVAECGLDGHHAFIVEYSPETDDRLSWHMDDAEVTLNLCLGDSFIGGDLVFRGRRCAWHRDSRWQPSEVFQYAHEPAVALIHAGTHRHEALPVTDGFRRNLIIWCTSGCYRERTAHICPSWCPDHRPSQFGS